MMAAMPNLWSQDVYLRALRFAALAHGEQKVPGTALPYVVHVTSVAMETSACVAAEGADDPDLAVACALLHDVLEDTATPLARLREAFGERVAAGVAALTKDGSLPKADAMRDSLDRIRRQPREVWLVKLADRITNLQPPPAHWTPTKVAAYRDEAAVILAALGPASPVLAARFAEKLEAYGR